MDFVAPFEIVQVTASMHGGRRTSRCRSGDFHESNGHRREEGEGVRRGLRVAAQWRGLRHGIELRATGARVWLCGHRIAERVASRSSLGSTRCVFWHRPRFRGNPCRPRSANSDRHGSRFFLRRARCLRRSRPAAVENAYLVDEIGQYTMIRLQLSSIPPIANRSFNGAIVSAGHKGYCSLLIVELLTGLLAGLGPSSQNDFPPTTDRSVARGRRSSWPSTWTPFCRLDEFKTLDRPTRERPSGHAPREGI